MSKEVTLNELAEMVQTGFEETVRKADHRFNDLGTRLDRIDARLADIERVILADHLQRIERLERVVGLPKNPR